MAKKKRHSFRTKLKSLMAMHDMSYGDMQELTKLSKSTIFNYVNGLSVPNIDRIKIIEDAFRLKRGTLFV